jgi:tetratricopeptide (TPR) repeat protein
LKANHILFKKKVVKLKKHGDKAFNESNFEKAYKLYSEALIFDEKDYDLIACLIGAALNLGYLNEVIEKSDYLINLNGQKAQGYYLKGIANHVIFRYEEAIDLFLKALEFEKEHAILIVKNLIKTITKYLDIEETFQFDDDDNSI